MHLIDVFPDAPKVNRLLVVEPDTEVQPLDFWVWMRSLQGIVNRTDPHLYYVRDFQKSAQRKNRLNKEYHWVDYYEKTFGIPHEALGDIDELIERYKDRVAGYVLTDTADVLQTVNVGITMAGLDGLLPISPDQEHWMTRHGITKRDDLTGKWSNNWDAAEWAIDTLWPRCNRRLFGNFCIHRAHWFSHSHEPADYIVANKGLALDLPTSRQRRRVLELYRRMLSEGEKPGVQMNWHCAYDQEKEYVAEAAKQGFMTLQTMFMPNLTVHGGIGDPDASYKQPIPKPEECRAEKGKIYVCFYNSDGDAASVQHTLQNGNWEAEKRGSFKFGWGILPLTIKLMPAMVRYFHETRTPNDCFFGPSSGAAYTYTYLWPEEHVDTYLRGSRDLLDQTGQHGCNMVNWNLWDWWREVETDAPIRREQRAFGSPGLVCGLGGNPYAKSWLDAKAPKVHAVGIANVGRNNIESILKFGEDCKTRPLFMFLFAQISTGIWNQLESEMPLLAEHPEIEILSMDEFLLTLGDATRRGLVTDELYEKNDTLAETWLKAPGRHRLPIAEKVTAELAAVAHAESAERARHLSEAGWTDLVSRELEGVAGDREKFLAYFAGRFPAFTEDEIPDALFYAAFIVAWHVVRAAITSQGVYANHRDQCLADFVRLCADHCDTSVFEELFAAWERWEEPYTPPLEQTIAWCDQLAVETRKLRDALGPDESEAAYASWPPRTI